eukprot:g341.t1
MAAAATLGMTFGYVFDLIWHACDKTKDDDVMKKKNVCTRKSFLRFFVVFAVLGGVVAYSISATLRSVGSYRNPIYEVEVKKEMSLKFPSLYICDDEQRSKNDSVIGSDAIYEGAVCLIDDAWEFDPTKIVLENATRCSVSATKIPGEQLPGGKLRNYTCAVFNAEAPYVAAVATSAHVTSMHVAFAGKFTRPLAALIVDNSYDFPRQAEPNFVFSSRTDVFVLLRKFKTPGIVYDTTISSSTRYDSEDKRDVLTHLSLSFASFDVSTMTETVSFTWLDALAAIGGATCFARVALLLLPNDEERRKERARELRATSRQEEEGDIESESCADHSHDADAAGSARAGVLSHPLLSDLDAKGDLVLVCCVRSGESGLFDKQLRGAGIFKGCKAHYTCCAEFDFFIPMGARCVENEPAEKFYQREKDNCARNGQGPVPVWARAETEEWRKYGVCNSSTPVVTRETLERKEAIQREWNKQYDQLCTKNAAGCSASETCYYDSTHKSGAASISRSGLPPKEAACLCEFPKGRESADGTGECVRCEADPSTHNPAYVLNVPGNTSSGAKVFAYGDEFACALGRASS